MPPMHHKPTVLMNTLADVFESTGNTVIKIQRPSRKFTVDFLALYGWGGNYQQQVIKKCVEGRITYLAFDLGYWDRAGFSKRKWRVSINNWHCPDRIMNGPYFGSARKTPDIKKDEVNDNGHILLVGSSPKSTKVGAEGWSLWMSKQIRALFPDHELVYRPKPGRVSEKVYCDRVSKNEDIVSAMHGARLVVCRHSNVSIDAAIHGIPCVAEDGAGSAIYPKKINEFRNQPDIKLRRSLINRLAWWQWSILEMKSDAEKFTSWVEAQINAL